jgi:hypothetical protein
MSYYLSMPTGRFNTMQDFFSFVPLDDPDENVCTLWQGPKYAQGYGQFSNKLGISTRAHRAIWEIAYGKIPKGQFVCHKCDNPLCIRLSHLFLGTPKENMEDMIKKGRALKAKGEKSGNAILTETIVLAIRKMAANGVLIRTISETFAVQKQLVRRIIKRKDWAWL